MVDFRYWTTYEHRIVAAHYPTIGTTCAELLDRTPRAVKAYAGRHGIKANRSFISRERERSKR